VHRLEEKHLVVEPLAAKQLYEVGGEYLVALQRQVGLAQGTHPPAQVLHQGAVGYHGFAVGIGEAAVISA